MPHILSNFSNSVKLKYVKLGYQYLVNHIITLTLILPIVAIFIEVISVGPYEILNLLNSLDFDLVSIICPSIPIILITILYFMQKQPTIYLVDYACFKLPITCQFPFATFMEHSKIILKNNLKNVEFQMRILEQPGLVEENSLPHEIHYIPPKPTMEAAIIVLPNSLFRMGGVVILLSNRISDHARAKSTLYHIVRTPKGDDDKAYCSVFEEEDKEGKIGIQLSKYLMAIASEVLKSNIRTIGPLFLPNSEQLGFIVTLLARKYLNPKWTPYILDFKQAFEHFNIHVGDRAVIDEL
ncbi:hypothetical protein TanjilG_30500 [Lupinus angustifolius]|uniref:FAE domain-containing protein n=1 Tax=Lupinus angustifolius TaxID=3871 RepID=A0A394DME1_LUPAN|nr:hypothetical protein TanjilG_30500 [Lupinus angustifolius]